jgi:acetyl esterase/lipase
MQTLSIRDPGVKGKIWVSRVTFPVPEEVEGGIRDVTLRSVKELGDGTEKYWEPQLEPLEAEWTGYRKNARPDEPEASITESAKYDNLIKEVTSDVVILYFHGGAHFLMDPASHRGLVTQLARRNGGRVLSVRYRLSPQNPFPAALMDGLFSYLALLHPPPGSPHKPVPASNIVFAGDSAGGQMCASLLQLILQLHRSPAGPKVHFHGAEIAVPFPAGIAMNSPWLDINRSMPSIWSNAKYDYLPPPLETGDPEPLPCDIWPTNPPRADLFCDGTALCHPLVSPLAALDWKNAPPVFIVTGEECLSDEDKILAQRMHSQGVKVLWEQYEAMPHVFAMVFEKTKVSNMSFDGWASAIKSFVEKPGEVESKGVWVTAKKLVVKTVAPGGDPFLTDEECLKRMRESREKRMKGFNDVLKARPVEPVAEPRL